MISFRWDKERKCWKKMTKMKRVTFSSFLLIVLPIKSTPVPPPIPVTLSFQRPLALSTTSLRISVKRRWPLKVITNTYGNRGDRGINGRSLADLHLVYRLLEDGTPGIGSRNHVYLDDRLWIFSTLVSSLYGNAELFACVQLSHGFDQAGLRIDFKFM